MAPMVQPLQALMGLEEELKREMSPDASPAKRQKAEGDPSGAKAEADAAAGAGLQLAAPVAAATVPPKASARPTVAQPHLCPESTAKLLLAGESLNTPMTAEERSASRTKNDRSLVPTSQRHGRSVKCPEAVALRIKNDSSTMAITRSYYFDLWVHCSGEWGRVEVVEQHLQRIITKLNTKKKWLMEHEIRALHPLESVASAIITNKRACPSLWRPNPDAPEEPSAIQFLITVEDIEEWAKETEDTSITKLTADLDADAAATIMPLRIPQATGGAPAPAATLPQQQVAGLSAEQAKETAEREQRVREAKEAKERQKKETKDKQKSDKEERKNSTAGKADKEMAKLQKDLVICTELVAECKSTTLSNVPQAKRTSFLKLFEMEAKTIKDLCKDLLDEDKMENAIEQAQRASCGFRDEAKAWKKAKLVYA